MHARPRAKVNLTLRVGERGRDGYHPLESQFLRVGLADELVVAFGNNEGGDALTVSGLPGCEVDGNLVLSAFRAVRRALGQELPPLVAHLDKRIPVGGGLGGGSADAASAVDCALQMWGAGLSPALLNQVALELGADVPFFARNVDAALVTGRGEHVEARTVATDLGLLLVAPPVAMSTAAVFARFDELDHDSTSIEPEKADLVHLPETYAALRDANDLWPAAVSLAPALGTVREELERLSDRPWLMSGSGSSLIRDLRVGRASRGFRPRARGVRIGCTGRRPCQRRRSCRPRPTLEVSMTRRAIQTSNAPAAVASYSQAIDTGNLVFLAGQVGLDPQTNELVEGGVEAQAERALRNLTAVLDAAGLSMADVVKTTCFLADINDFAAFNGVYAQVRDGSATRALDVRGCSPAEGRAGRNRGDRRPQQRLATDRNLPTGSWVRAPARPGRRRPRRSVGHRTKTRARRSSVIRVGSPQ